MQESEKVHFNLTVFALHVLCHDKARSVHTNIMLLPFFTER
jgi:hypothetical protein